MIVLPHLRSGGGQQLAVDEAIELSADSALEVELLSLYPREDTIFTKKAEQAGLILCYLNKTAGIRPLVILSVLKAMKRFCPDVVHTHLQVMPYVLFPAMLCHVQRRFHTVHNVAEREAGGLLRVIMRMAYTVGGFVPVAISDYCRGTICNLYGMQADKVPVVYNGIDIHRFFCRIPYEERPDNHIRIISTGRMQEVKRHDLIIEAFSELHKRFPQTELVLLGDGELRSQIEKEIRTLRLESCVSLKGTVAEVENELNRAHVYFMASDWEGLPLSVLEAMACGLPVVATKAGGTVDVVTEKTGILCNVGDKCAMIEALTKLITQPQLRFRMAREAERVALRYSIGSCAEEYKKLFIGGVQRGKS